jgi:hypothetical protein
MLGVRVVKRDDCQDGEQVYVFTANVLVFKRTSDIPCQAREGGSGGSH